MVKRKRQSKRIDPADLCRVVVLDKESGRWVPRCEWQKETEALHALAEKFRGEGAEAYVVAQGKAPAPSQNVSPGVKAGRGPVLRYTFPDGGTERTTPQELTAQRLENRSKPAADTEIAARLTQIRSRIRELDSEAIEKNEHAKASAWLMQHLLTDSQQSTDITNQRCLIEAAWNEFHNIKLLTEVVPAMDYLRASRGTLGKGRVAGVEARQVRAEQRQQAIKTVIDDLFRVGKARNMTDEQIRDYLLTLGIGAYKRSDGKLQNYTEKVMLKHARKYISRYR